MHGGRGPSRRPGGPVRPPPALPSRDSAAAGAVCSDTRAVTRHLRAPGTVARSRESPALIKGCGRDDGALRCSVFKTVSTGPRGTVRLLGLARRRAFRQRSRRRVPAECRAAFRSASRRAQVGDAPQARCSLSVVGAHVCVVRRGEKPQRASGKRRRFLQHGRVSCFGACSVGRDSSPRSSGF